MKTIYRYLGLLLVMAMLGNGASVSTVLAASVGVEFNTPEVETQPDQQVNMVVSTISDDDTFTDGTYVALSDEGAGGSFYTGTVGGACNASSPDSDSQFAIDQNKGVCYSNSTAGTYNVLAQLLDAQGGAAIGDAAMITVQVVEPLPEEVASLTIDTPALDEVVSGSYEFSATYLDADSDTDSVLWHIFAASCELDGTVVAGNIDDFTSDFTFDGSAFSATVDTAVLAMGAYCFVIDPQEDDGEDFQADVNFTVVSGITGAVDAVVFGCTDEGAENYDPQATEFGDSDEPCIYVIAGCLDPEAINYDPKSEIGGACVYEDEPKKIVDQDIPQTTESTSQSTRTNRNSDSSDDLATVTATPQVSASVTEGATVPRTCPVITQYLQYGADNDVFEVQKLQLFLQIVMQYEQEVTGIFDLTTFENVKQFQETYRPDVLDPWSENGEYVEATGYVYKLTTWKINDITCPDVTVRPEL